MGRKSNDYMLDYQAILRSSPDLYLILDPHLNILDVSNAYLKATMVQREDIRGRNIFDVFPDNPKDNNATGVSNLSASLQRVMQNKTADVMVVQKYDIRRPQSAGGEFEQRYWSAVNVPVLNENNEVTYIIHRVEDITEFTHLQTQRAEQLEIEEALRVDVGKMEREIYRRATEVQEKNEKLVAANKDLEAFNYTVSHDLRNSIQAISGFSSFLLRNYSFDPAVMDFITEISKAAEKMTQLINDLFSFSHAMRRKIKYEIIPLNLIIDDIFETLQKSLPNHSVSFLLQKNLEVEGDKDLLQIAFDNLLSNAWKYTSKNANPVIEVGGMKQTKEEIIYVRDNGIGFDMAKINLLFNPFTRLHSESDFPGTGIGLATVKRIIERHGGRIWAESEGLGKGATFYVALPKRK